jgi:hypothetical protein
MGIWLVITEPKKCKEFAQSVGGIRSVFFILIFAFLGLAAVYKFTGFDVFFEGFRQFMRRTGAGRSSFFMGNHPPKETDDATNRL